MIKVEVLGTGGAFDSFSTAYLIDDHILVDCGMEIVKELIHSKRLDKVDHLFLTHLHQDHVAGLEALIYYRRYVLNIPCSDVDKFTIHAGPDFLPFYSQLKCCYSPLGITVIDFNLVRNIQAAASIGELSITMPSVIHCGGSVPSFAVRIDNSHSTGTVLISGDTDRPLRLSDYDVDLLRPNTLVFHDMGWTGIEHILLDKAHPYEQEVFLENGECSNLIGVHTTKPLSFYRQAEKNEVFYV